MTTNSPLFFRLIPLFFRHMPLHSTQLCPLSALFRTYAALSMPPYSSRKSRITIKDQFPIMLSVSVFSRQIPTPSITKTWGTSPKLVARRAHRSPFGSYRAILENHICSHLVCSPYLIFLWSFIFLFLVLYCFIRLQLNCYTYYAPFFSSFHDAYLQIFDIVWYVSELTPKNHVFKLGSSALQ